MKSARSATSTGRSRSMTPIQNTVLERSVAETTGDFNYFLIDKSSFRALMHTTRHAKEPKFAKLRVLKDRVHSEFYRILNFTAISRNNSQWASEAISRICD